MQLDFDNMASLLEPGKQEIILDHFRLGPEFKDRFNQLSDAFSLHVTRLLQQAHVSGDTEPLHESLLLKTLFGMADQYIKPESAREVACVAYMVSSLLAGTHAIISPYVAIIHLRASASQTTTFYGGTATA
ncbi:hypothetical protein [Spirosoma sordidisoli]|uniref:Uncharacterized protein n=1 Tax=Spirosoma sordidisoli TaxID=2502893 RepID=A0A4Q2UK02_9BACT|nr:hypothetical protein [Spirosoma sordidisoli]RYC69837.1 hypothetical protein EQG79_14685 [Spirosoma sordidisoli]